ncbi:hypothetical protein AYO45_00950 [Gammaproteobacteria bacterium SCGC AG-212-F23]|nr:hypothetical protein AYO45_00950 [Gammaproteobacteria bacterium SCGC AG-212-F23]
MSLFLYDKVAVLGSSEILQLNNIDFQKLPYHLYIKNKKGTILDCNSYQAQSLGFKKSEDIIGSTGFDWLDADDAKEIEENDNNVIVTKTKKVVYENSRTESKKYFCAISFKFPLVNKLGTSIGVYGVSFVLPKKFFRDSLYGLTERQKDCLYYLAKGMSYKQIGKKIKLSPRTVENYLNAAKNKLSCSTRSELIDKLWESNFILNRLQDHLFGNDLSTDS